MIVAEVNSLTQISNPSATSAYVVYRPSPAELKAFGKGWFVVQYDVDADDAGELLVSAAHALFLSFFPLFFSFSFFLFYFFLFFSFFFFSFSFFLLRLLLNFLHLLFHAGVRVFVYVCVRGYSVRLFTDPPPPSCLLFTGG